MQTHPSLPSSLDQDQSAVAQCTKSPTSSPVSRVDEILSRGKLLGDMPGDYRPLGLRDRQLRGDPGDQLS
jgi:hypothetical protein